MVTYVRPGLLALDRHLDHLRPRLPDMQNQKNLTKRYIEGRSSSCVISFSYTPATGSAGPIASATATPLRRLSMWISFNSNH